MLATLGLEAIVLRPRDQLAEAVGADFPCRSVTAVFVLSVLIAAATLVGAASAQGILSLVLRVMNRKQSRRALRHVKTIDVDLSPRLEVLVGSAVVSVKH